ncbi:MAG: hypothetical protein QG594_1484 [Bacteroidota bacterium]|nr:hypothetical protein [Bacteroidota bacterium]
MTSKIISNGILRALANLVLLAMAVYFLYQTQTVILYLIISLILCLISNPTMQFLKNKLKFGNTLATVSILIIYILTLVFFVSLIVTLIISQAQNLSLLDTNDLQNQFLLIENQLETYLSTYNIDLRSILKNTNFSSKINYSYFTNFINSTLNVIANLGMGIASIFFISFFFLKDQMQFKEKAKMILPDKNEEKILNSIEKINTLLGRYFIGLLLQLLAIFILYLIVLLIFGSQNAFVIAFLCALLNIIPYIGPIIGTVLAGLLTLIGGIGTDFQTEMLPTTIYIVIGFMLVQVIDNNINQPLIFSKSINSHPLEIFLVILICGILFGIFGMVVAIPVYTIIKVVAKEFFPNNKIVSVLTQNI